MLSSFTASLNNQLKKKLLRPLAGRVVLVVKLPVQKNGEFILVSAAGCGRPAVSKPARYNAVYQED
jgi:hypothetical protein